MILLYPSQEEYTKMRKHRKKNGLNYLREPKRTGKYTRSLEHIEHISGTNNYFFGKHHTDETKKKLSLSHIGKPLFQLGLPMSQEQKDKISNAKLGRKATPETRLKLSISHMGKNGHGPSEHPFSLETRKKMSLAKLGKKMSLESRAKMSKARSGKGNNMYGKVVPRAGRGKRCYYNSPLQGNVCFKSSYELAYAKYLDANKILWLYEIETFDLGDTTYTPDFFLPAENMFIEIKGYMSDKHQYKINMFKEQYPWDLDVLFKEDMNKIGIEGIR